MRSWNGWGEEGRVDALNENAHAFLLNARYGPHYLGLELQADMDAVREVIAARGIGIARDIGFAVHTHPADTLGVSFEFYDGEFHQRECTANGRARTVSCWSAARLCAALHAGTNAGAR